MARSPERRIQFVPGYNKRSTQYGVHGMGIRFLLVEELGTVQFVLNTGWIPGETARQRYPAVSRANSSSPRETAGLFPMAVDLGYHWRTNPHPDSEYAYKTEKCEALDGADCWYDGSGLSAERVMEKFIDEGEPAVWKELVEYYRYLAETYPPPVE